MCVIVKQNTIMLSHILFQSGQFILKPIFFLLVYIKKLQHLFYKNNSKNFRSRSSKIEIFSPSSFFYSKRNL